MKVCQYVPHGAIPDIRGFAPAIVAQQFYKNFSEEIEHYFVCNQEEYLDSMVEDKEFGKIFRIKEGKIYKRLFQKITKLDPYPLYKKLANIINKNDIDILHVHQLEFPINKFKKLIKNKKIKIIVHSHVLRNFNKNKGIANRYIAVSNYTKKLLSTKRNYPENLINVVYNGVDTDLFSNKNIDNLKKYKKEYDVLENSIVLSYIGRKQEAKGFFTALRVFKYFLERYNNIFIFCVGPTPNNVVDDEHYKDEQELLNILSDNKYFTNLPALKHNELSKVYKISDIIVFPTYGEQHPLVALETISSNTILISTNDFSLPEIIENNYSGFLIDNPKNENEIISIIDKIVKDVNNFNHIKENASKIATEKFDWKISTSKLEKIYHEVIGEGN